MTYFQKISKTFLSDIWLGRCFCREPEENIKPAQYFMSIIGHIFCF